MEDSAFSDEFCRFLQTIIPSVDAAELALRISGEAERWWDPAEFGEAARFLELLQSGGLIAIGPDKRVQYRPANEIVAGHVVTLAQAYKERPVTLFRMIYALRDLKIQSFADAFKLKRK
jgi:hypothetical protein